MVWVRTELVPQWLEKGAARTLAKITARGYVKSGRGAWQKDFDFGQTRDWSGLVTASATLTAVHLQLVRLSFAHLSLSTTLLSLSPRLQGNTLFSRAKTPHP